MPNSYFILATFLIQGEWRGPAKHERALPVVHSKLGLNNTVTYTCFLFTCLIFTLLKVDTQTFL